MLCVNPFSMFNVMRSSQYHEGCRPPPGGQCQYKNFLPFCDAISDLIKNSSGI